MFNKDAAEDEEPERRGVPREPTTIQRAAVRGDGRTSAGGNTIMFRIGGILSNHQHTFCDLFI